MSSQKYNAASTQNALFKNLLNKIELVDFNCLAKTSEKGKKQILQRDLIVCAVDEFRRVAEINGWGICKMNEAVHFFNGMYWLMIEKGDFKSFLGDAAWKMGIRRPQAKYYKFQEQLYLQFMSLAGLTKRVNDSDRTIINLKNGTFEILQKEIRLKPFDKDDGLTYQLPFEYNKQAASPKFQTYLNHVLPDKSLQQILAEYIGYVFVKGLKLEKCLLLYGSGANGKSVFFDIIDALLGEENISHLSLDSLGIEYNRALIGNKLLNYGSEIKGSIHVDIFKQLVSREPILCCRKYEHPFILRDYARLCFNCNELPKGVEHNEAYFRRFLIIPFNVTIPEKERNPNLAKEIIKRELSGIFNWVLEGMQRLLTNQKFTESEIVIKALDTYKEQSDNIFQFIDETGYQKDLNGFALIKTLYPAYRKYCSENGYAPYNKINFKKRLLQLGHEEHRNNQGIGVRISLRKP